MSPDHTPLPKLPGSLLDMLDENEAGMVSFRCPDKETGKIKVKTSDIVPLVIANHKKIASVDNLMNYLFQLSRKLSNVG